LRQRLLIFLTALVFVVTPTYAEDICCNGTIVELTLQEAEVLALRNNYLVRSLFELSEGGYFGFRESVGQWLPEVTFFCSARRINEGSIYGYATVYDSTLRFAQKVFDTDAFFDIRETYLDFQRLKADFRRQMADALFEVRVAYYAVVLAQEQVAVEENNVSLFQEEFDRQKGFLDVGRSIQFEVDQTRANLANAVAAYHQAVQDLKIAKHELLSVLGLDPAMCITLAEKELTFHAIPEMEEKMYFCEKQSCPPLFSECNIQDWEEIALQYQPEIEFDKYTAEIQEVNTRRQLGRYAPKVNIFATYFNNSGGRVTNLIQKSFWNMGVRLDWQLFDGFQRENRIVRARKDQRAAELNYGQTVLDAKVDVRNRISEIEESWHQYRATQVGYEVSQESVDYARNRLDVGRIIPLEYRDAINTLRFTWQDLNQTKFDILRAYFGLERASGIDLYNIDCNNESC